MNLEFFGWESGAQGHGASTNEKMAHSLLEKKLNNTFQNLDLNINVINLATWLVMKQKLSPLLRAFGPD